MWSAYPNVSLLMDHVSSGFAADCGGFDVRCASENNGGRCEHPMLQLGRSLPTERKILRKRSSVLPPSVGLTEGKF